MAFGVGWEENDLWGLWVGQVNPWFLWLCPKSGTVPRSSLNNVIFDVQICYGTLTPSTLAQHIDRNRGKQHPLPIGGHLVESWLSKSKQPLIWTQPKACSSYCMVLKTKLSGAILKVFACITDIHRCSTCHHVQFCKFCICHTSRAESLYFEGLHVKPICHGELVLYPTAPTLSNAIMVQIGSTNPK